MDFYLPRGEMPPEKFFNEIIRWMVTSKIVFFETVVDDPIPLTKGIHYIYMSSYQPWYHGMYPNETITGGGEFQISMDVPWQFQGPLGLQC